MFPLVHSFDVTFLNSLIKNIWQRWLNIYEVSKSFLILVLIFPKKCIYDMMSACHQLEKPRSILYVFIMSRTRFRVNPHSIVA